jgi:hypothetical protein
MGVCGGSPHPPRFARHPPPQAGEGRDYAAAAVNGARRLRRASQLTDERCLWYRPTMAALRALKKIAANDGCSRQKVVAAPRCLRLNGEDFCQ